MGNPMPVVESNGPVPAAISPVGEIVSPDKGGEVDAAKTAAPAKDENPDLLKAYCSGFGLVDLSDEWNNKNIPVNPLYNFDEDFNPTLVDQAPFSYLNLFLGLDYTGWAKYTKLLVNFEYKNGTVAFNKGGIYVSGDGYAIKAGDILHYVDPLSVQQTPIHEKYNPAIFDLDGQYTINLDTPWRPENQKYLIGMLKEVPLLGFYGYYKYAEICASQLNGGRYFYNARAGKFSDKARVTDFLPEGEKIFYLNFVNVLEDPKNFTTVAPLNNYVLGGFGKINIAKTFNMKVGYYTSSLIKTNYFHVTNKTSSAMDLGLELKSGNFLLGADYLMVKPYYFALAAQSPYAEISRAKTFKILDIESYTNIMVEDTAFPQGDATPDRSGTKIGFNFDNASLKLSAEYRLGSSISKTPQYFVAMNSNVQLSSGLNASSLNVGGRFFLGKYLSVEGGYRATSLKTVKTELEDKTSVLSAGATIFLPLAFQLLYGYKSFDRTTVRAAVKNDTHYIANAFAITYPLMKTCTIMFETKWLEKSVTVANVKADSLTTTSVLLQAMYTF